MIDDRVGVQIYDRKNPEGSTFDRFAFEASDIAYERAGLERHPKKEKRRVDNACFWGAELEGKTGLLGAPRHKLAALMVLLTTLARIGVATNEVIEVRMALS